uniref:C2H2-type domain-containing protein n=1 Tax=Oreochromis niloticus TaxID=8128 RepID=A0A669CK10_ORENI
MTDAKLADGTKETIILQESPSSSCPNSSGVFKVTAKSVIDITGSKSYPFLHTDLTTDLTPSKTPEQFRKETVPGSAVKRSSGKSSKGHPAKKAKLDNEEMLTEKENESRQQSSIVVMHVHYQKSHPDEMKMNKKKKKTKRHSKSLVISATSSVKTPQTKRSLNCYMCGYKTGVIYALKKHLSKTHKVNRTFTDILRYYFRQGSLEPGYHCEFCVFRHEKAAVVYEHYQERHPARVPCVEYVSTQLYAGPGMVPPKKKKAGISCKRCSFKSKSLSDLAHHYRIVHPLSAKLAKKANASWRVEDQSDRRGSSDSYQFGKLRASSTVFKCLYCSANFNSKHGLHVHCGLKHPEAKFKSSITAEESLLIYKCPKCPYVNASYHATLAHCQMKHPAIVVRADELETDEVFASNMVKCTLGKGSNERGYLCKKCSQIHGSLRKLNAHRKKVHHDTEVYEHTDTESQPVHTSQGSAQKNASVKNKTSRKVSIAKSRQASQTETPDACPSTLLSGVRSNKQLYKCQMCTYKGANRKYLQCHYKNTHKLDAVSIYKLLEKYNVLKSGNSTKVKCLKCPDLTFKSSQLLIDHYSTFHRSEWKLDFTVLSLGSPKKKTTGVYKCDHCNTQLIGIRKVCYHMDHHRARMLEMAKAAQRKESLVSTTIEQESSKVNETATLETVNEVNRWNGTPVPSAATSELSDVQQPELESNEDKHTCKQCGRMFMSLKGLHSHEHSHAALAAIKKLDNSSTSGLKHKFDKEFSNSSEKMNSLPEIDEGRELIKGKLVFLCVFFFFVVVKLGLGFHKTNSFWFCSSTDRLWLLETLTGSLYLEPPDVRRQLNHYTMMAQSSIKSKVNMQLSKLPENSVLHCEFCNFSTGHLSSIRRHCLNWHGKKILRCKDCNFFTGLRKTLEMHMETGHSTCQSKPTHQKDLCCPFCLYQTKNKNNMIDHIVLHREGRLVPIEVRRPKLSRYLQGIIFRCHKCTFTSGSPENLRLHMMRHDDIKPYKCRLCYFDCTQLSDLEAHLSDKIHQNDIFKCQPCIFFSSTASLSQATYRQWTYFCKRMVLFT